MGNALCTISTSALIFEKWFEFEQVSEVRESEMVILGQALAKKNAEQIV